MARHQRHTEPVETLDGWISSYEEIEIQLIAGEVRGRLWLLQPERGRPDIEENILGPAPTDYDIRDLHQAMFGDLFAWAGQTRKKDVGPGGKVPVPWMHVAHQLRDFTLDLQFWIEPLRNSPEPLTTEQMAGVIARAHHRFQYIHPFQDTNGRTGRVFDHFLLWITFAQGGDDLETSPVLEYFPDGASEAEYYEGLQEADNHDLTRLQHFYTKCIERALSEPDSFVL